MLMAGFVVTGIFTILIHSSLGYFVHYLLFFILTATWVFPQLRSLTTAFLIAIIHFFKAQWLFLKTIVESQVENKRIGSYVSKAFIFIIPVAVILIFIVIYRNSNPVFDEWFGIADNWINRVWEAVFKNFDELILFTLFVSLLFSNFILLRGTKTSFFQMDQLSLETAQRNRKPGLFQFRNTALKSEYKAAIFLLGALNLLLLLMNISDVYLVWLNFEWEGQYLKQFVHEGTYLLIFSILISIGIVLYFFRGNLNFYSKNRTLKKLSYIWLAQNAFLVVSVAIRNYWYIYYFALAYKRIGVLLFLLLTLYGLYTVYRKVSERKTAIYLFRTNFHMMLLVLTLASLINWDTLIARYNFAHADRSFLHLDFLTELSDKTLPYLDKPLNELIAIEKVQKQKFPFQDRYMHSEEYVEIIEDRKEAFKMKWEEKSWLEWNLAEYLAYKKLTKEVQ